MQFMPPITASASALSIGSCPQIARYVGRCVVRNTRFRPQTKYAPDITRNGRWRAACPIISRIVVLAAPRHPVGSAGAEGRRQHRSRKSEEEQRTNPPGLVREQGLRRKRDQ